MKVIITGGGTAGHVTPLLAVVSELKKRHPAAKIRYIGQLGDPMSRMVKEQGIVERRYHIFAGKWRRYHTVSFFGHLKDVKTVLKNIRDIFLITLGFSQSLIILIFWRPQIIFVKGGYVSLPVGLAAAVLKIPFITHDSDSIPGLTNRVISRFAKLNAVGLPSEIYEEYYPKSKLRFTGIPIDPAFYAIDDETKKDARSYFGVGKEPWVIAFLGGSLGATRLNEVIIKILPSLQKMGIFIIWVTGARQYENLTNRVAKMNLDDKRIHIVAFTNEMPKIVAASDLVISRAGATILAELAAAKKPVILVPNPILAGGHQLKNARALADLEAAAVVTEQQIQGDPSYFSNRIIDLLKDEKSRAKLGANFNRASVPDSSSKIVETIDEVLSK